MSQKQRGYPLLQNPLLNKELGFTDTERKELSLRGLLPFQTLSIEQQLERLYLQFQEQQGDRAKCLFLSQIRSVNELLFFRFLMEHVQEMVPLVYTPTIGQIASDYSLLYTEQRGLYLSYPYKGFIAELVASFPFDDVDVIVITDGERVLGLGDLGVGGMAISAGKLTLYTLFGGIHPRKTLPVVIDVGTNNEKLLNDPLYVGWKHTRVLEKEYREFVEEVVSALQNRFKHVLLQWEDFGKNHAMSLLKTYQNRLCSFNDDIQGTAAVVLAAAYSAIEVTGIPLHEQRIVVLGGGSAGMGICLQLMQAMMQDKKVSLETAQRSFYVLDRQGLIHDTMEHLDPIQRQFARSHEEMMQWKQSQPLSLKQTIEIAKPTMLIGVSTKQGAFSEDIVRTMHQFVERPIIFPLSNPTSCAEATPQDLLQWTEGKAIVATGSPFPPAQYDGKEYPNSQCNNVYIFPGVGLGLIATRCKKVEDELFIVAAKTLSRYCPKINDPDGPLFPPLADLRKVSREIAIAVAEEVIRKNLHQVPQESCDKLVDKVIWHPSYTCDET